MTGDPADDPETAAFVAAVREAVADREDARLVEIREANPGSAEAVLEEWGEDTEPRRYLYHVTREPDMESGDHLHWKYLGDVVPDGG